MNRWLITLLTIAAALWIYQQLSSPSYPVGADGAFSYPGYELSALEPFEIRARVLSVEHYRHDREADLSPVDLAIGWGDMADPEVLRSFTVRQSNRFYFWKTPKLVIPRRAIETQSANVHIVPANPSVLQQLRSVRPGDEVRLVGDLIEVRSQEDGWRWRSSLSREDTGRGACELLLLTHLEHSPASA